MTVVELPRPGRPERARLFPDQAEAVERLVRHLRRAGTRGLFVSATGTGKTLVSIRTADGLGARLVLFVVPPWIWPRRPRWRGAGTVTWSTW
ncbi:DEAD/DEAH box helicase family protein [Streptomyces scabiei]|uniref:DEAD/DEAH box helicase family protein n=1 Tax=Streptomyces scabiei TaxID=1930 RepID=UPI001FF64E30|nr:DEAD/DEAH box helicase family protein [Streptomyces sp. LBUM 1482]